MGYRICFFLLLGLCNFQEFKLALKEVHECLSKSPVLSWFFLAIYVQFLCLRQFKTELVIFIRIILFFTVILRQSIFCSYSKVYSLFEGILYSIYGFCQSNMFIRRLFFQSCYCGLSVVIQTVCVCLTDHAAEILYQFSSFPQQFTLKNWKQNCKLKAFFSGQLCNFYC